MKYSHFEIDSMLKDMIVLIDTREQDTPALRQRIRDMGCPVERQKLEFGDYSVKTRLPGGRELNLSSQVALERKMSLGELCQCYGTGRPRFQREHERAKARGARLILLVEQASWGRIFSGDYRSRLTPNALTASLLAWSMRYGVLVLFCNPEESGRLIYKTLYYALKVYLEQMEVENGEGTI